MENENIENKASSPKIYKNEKKNISIIKEDNNKINNNNNNEI